MAKPRRKLTVLRDDASGLPLFSARWLPEILAAPLPEEPLATCDSCAMLPPEGERFTTDSGYFSPKARCCTFVPLLANFLVGGLLLDPDPALTPGRTRVMERITRRSGVSPLGI